jgi:hypothetical protein
MSVLPDTDAIAHEIVALCAGVGLRAIPYEPTGAWQAPCLLVPPPSIQKVTPAIYAYTYELIWVERSAQARAAASNLSQTVIRLRNALQSDKTLGGTASGCWVRGIRPDDEIRDQQSNYWYGARLDFEVWTSE